MAERLVPSFSEEKGSSFWPPSGGRFFGSRELLHISMGLHYLSQKFNESREVWGALIIRGYLNGNENGRSSNS
jgi:hypothetical protein